MTKSKRQKAKSMLHARACVCILCVCVCVCVYVPFPPRLRTRVVDLDLEPRDGALTQRAEEPGQVVAAAVAGEVPALVAEPGPLDDGPQCPDARRHDGLGGRRWRRGTSRPQGRRRRDGHVGGRHVLEGVRVAADVDEGGVLQGTQRGAHRLEDAGRGVVDPGDGEADVV